MQFDGDTLTISADMTMEEIAGFEAFVRPRVDYIERIDVEGNMLKSSALLSLLSSVKRTRADVAIPFLEKGSCATPQSGTLHWMGHD